MRRARYARVSALAPGARGRNNPAVTAPAAPVLRLDQVGRRLAGRAVVRGLDLEARRGEVLGLLGVNGAGKTTTLRMMAGVLAPDSGQVRIEGEDLAEHPALARRRIGYLPEVPPLHEELTPREFLRFCARLHGVARAAAAAAVDRALERCDLDAVRNRPIATLSKGFRQRVGLAQALVHEPALMILDEPASGLDPVQAMNLRALVRSLGREHAVVLSTHVLPDVAACCDRVAILHEGVLRHVGPAAGEACELRVAFAAAPATWPWATLPMVRGATAIDATHWRVRLAAGADVDGFAHALAAHGLVPTELVAGDDTLERRFLAIAAGEADAVHA
jgi:ABC-2 type transport system ATP-binding protein